MAYPINSGGAYNGINPAYSGTFIPELWSKKLNVKFYKNTMLSEITNTDYEGELKNQGDTIKIRTIPNVTIRDYEIGQTLNYEVPTPNTIDMQIDKGKYFGVQVNDVIAHQSDLGLMDMFTEDASKQLKIQIENDVFLSSFITEGPHASNVGATAGAISGGYNLGTKAAAIDSSTADNVLNTILSMSSVLDEQNVPEEGRWLIMTPYDRHVLMKSSIAQAYFSGDSSSTIRTGKIGMLDRFTIYISNLLPRGDADKAWVGGHDDPAAGAADVGAVKRRMMVAGTRHAVSFAQQITKTEPLRNQTDFGDIVRGLSIFGHKVIKSEAMTYAVLA